MDGEGIRGKRIRDVTVDNIIGITSLLEAFVALPLLSIVSGHRAKLVQRPNAKLKLEKGIH